MKHRTVLSAALSASALLFLSAPAGATTTLYRFCSDSSDNSTYTENRASAAAAGWSINDPGADTKLGDGSYTYAFRMKNTTSVVSPTYTDGFAITKVVVGARVTNLERVYHVNPSVGSEQTQTLTQTGVRQELEFDFDSSEGVTSVTITTPSGTGNSYLYDVTITILKPLTTPANLALVGDAGENEFTVSWGSVSGALSYSVTLLDALGGTVDTQSHTPSDRTATFSGLTSSTAYTVSVVAIGDHTATDDSAPKTLEVETAASSIAAPTLVVANTSWTAGVAGTSAVSATLAGGESCAFASVEMSDGSSATVDNGILSWTPPASTTASSVTATFHVTYGSNGWDIDQVLSVAATPAPGAPSLTLSNATAQSFDASWAATAGGPVVEYKIRAWTGRATPDDATGGATEDFADYASAGTVPAGWIFKNSGSPYGSYSEAPVDFRGGSSSVTYWIGSPDFGGTISSFSFHLRKVSGVTGTFKVYGSTGSTNQADWVEIKTLADGEVATGSYSVDALENGDPLASAGFSRLFFRTVKTAGNFAFGTFSVSGTDWPAANFLEDWGGAKVSVGTATSQTFANPVPGTANYVEVTAIGLAGLSARTIDSIAVPAAPRKPVLISIQ